MMNPELKSKWVEALRSGKFKQGRAFLKAKKGDGAMEHCCLGVLCEITDTVWLEEPEYNKTHSLLFFKMIPDGGSEAYGSILVGAKVGLLAPGDAWTAARRMNQLISMNDAKESFDTIADYIEENL